MAVTTGGTGQYDSLVGVWILDQYKLLKRIGSGGMGQVYLADQPAMGRKAAIKIVRAQGASEDARQRFRREARAVSRLSHPNIVTVFNFGELADGSLFLAMEMVTGIRLRSLLSRGRLPSLRAINLTYQCAAALGFAHSRKIVHRDFKPENVVVSRLIGRDHIKVLDFGIARFLDETSRLSQPEVLLGTPEYISPEQCRGEEATSHSDQYALGLVFFEMLAGRQALEAKTPFEYLQLHGEVEPPSPSEVHDEPELKLLDPIFKKMVARDPLDRFATMERLQEALDGAVVKILSLSAKAPAGDPAEPVDPIQLEQRVTKLEAVSGPLCRVQIISDPNVLPSSSREELVRRGLYVHPGALQLDQLAGELPPAQLWVMAVRREGVREAARQLDRSALPLHRTLLCVDAPIDQEGLVLVPEHAERFVIGEFPQDPLTIELALRWLLRNDVSVIDALGIGATVVEAELARSEERRGLVESILADLRAEGVSTTVQQAAREVVEELATNAARHTAGEATQRVGATLRWAVTEELVLIALRDFSGSIKPHEIVSRTTGPSITPVDPTEGGGAGLGLRIISRAAQHLLFLIRPEVDCEIVALLRRRPWRQAPWARTLAVLRAEAAAEARVGDHLWLTHVARHRPLKLVLRGEIDESADLTPVFSRSGRVQLDLSEVTAVTSLGIQQWLTAHRHRDPCLELELVACSQPVVRQLSMLPLLTETGDVISVQAPYHCVACGRETFVILEVDKLEDLPPAGGTCDVCGGELGFDEMPELYFAFLGRPDAELE